MALVICILGLRIVYILLQNLTKSTGFLDATINHLIQLRKLQASFPVVSWPAFIEMTRSCVNPLAGEVHCRQLIQQLQLMGEVNVVIVC